jgi:ABC-type proline/glycine betaine transport system permease subunit
VQLDEALSQISEIRQQMAQAQVFRGYRSATTAFTALVAGAAAAAQARWVPDPVRHLDAYLVVWCAAAVVGAAVVGVEMAVRSSRSGSSLQRQITLVVVDQFAPSLAAGALLTFVVAQFARDAGWMMPGLWAVVFSLGLFASRRFMPRGVFLLAGYYLLAGLGCLTLEPARAMSPWTMGGMFGVGQLLTALFLYWTLERGHGRE